MKLPVPQGAVYDGTSHRRISTDLIIDACPAGKMSAKEINTHLPVTARGVVENSDQILIRKMCVEDTVLAMALLSQWNMAPVQASSSIPHPERDHLELDNTFVAVLQGKLVGVASWLRIDATHAETASLAVDRAFIGCGVGQKLHEARVAEMRSNGIVHVRTETDRPEVIRWYIDKFGYQVVGTNRKKHAFSRVDQDYWTVLELQFDKD